MENGLKSYILSTNDRIDRLANIVEHGFATFNSKSLKKFSKMNSSVDSAIDILKAIAGEAKFSGLALKEGEESIVSVEHEISASHSHR
jgi:hypothetical protein